MNLTDTEKKMIVYAIIGITGIYIFKSFFNKVLETVGVIPDETDRDAEKAVKKADRKKYFSRSFNQGVKGNILLLTDKNAKIKANNIYNAFGLLSDKADIVKAQFDNLRTKSQVSQIAVVFYQIYGRELLSFLHDKMDTDSQQKTLANILNQLDKLPNYWDKGYTPVKREKKPPLAASKDVKRPNLKVITPQKI